MSFCACDTRLFKKYKEYMEYAQKNNFGLSKYAFLDALEAEKIHRQLFQKAISDHENNNDIPMSNYYTCTSCGYTFKINDTPKFCPVCGAPFDKINEVL